MLGQTGIAAGATAGVLLVGVLMGGCLSSLQPEGPDLDAWSLSYACGPGHELPLPGGGCMGRLSDPQRTLGEAQVALHPVEPGTFAVAVSDGRRPDALPADLPTVAPRGLAVYVTRDGGQSFTRSAIDLHAAGALPYNVVAMGADPALVFTPDGALHLAGLAITGSAGTASNPVSLATTLFTTRSLDLGATWEDPVVVMSGNSNDREWLAASPQGEVVLTWRDHTRGLSMAARGEGGIGESSRPFDLPGCNQVSNAVWAGGVALAACQEGNGVRVIELSDPPVPRGLAPGGCPSNSARLAGGPDGVLVATCYYGSAVVSLDGGWTWTRVMDLLEKTGVEDGWDAGIGPNVFAVAADTAGAVHLTLSRFPSSNDQQPGGDGRPVAHVVLDPVTGEFLHEREVQAESSGEGPVGYGFADDFWSIDFVGSRGVVVWTSSDWAVHYAVVDIQD